jgi:hypothetical protein
MGGFLFHTWGLRIDTERDAHHARKRGMLAQGMQDVLYFK